MSRASSVARRARRALGKSPQEIARRLVEEATREVEAVIGPRRARRFDDARLLEAVDAPSLVELWERIRARPYPAVTTPAEATAIAGHRDVLEAAENACGSRVDLLGSGPQRLTSPIDWHTDFTTGFSWPLAIARRIDYVNLDRPSDVKIPWELSRLQWLLPVGEAYLLTGDERYARHARDVLEDWIAANPYGRGVNWAVALEAAMRVFTWTWLFHALAGSDAWQEDAFRSAFLRTLFLHGHFIDRNIERSDVNGNHYTADAAGLVFVGSFFGQGSAATRWAARGWTILLDEQPRQLNADGVDFEASVPYHRLVTELFCLPALYRRRLGLAVPESYDERLRSAAAFAATYTRVDGTSPHWGDADDARMLPLGRGRLTDHRYLAGLVGVDYSGPTTDVAWIRGPAEAAELEGGEVPGSASFPLGGFHVLRREGDHAFFDCGPIGLAGRGGHGHNDALAFELALDGVTLITDSGSYVYTADWRARNEFRSTRFHSTPQVDEGEINRFVSPDALWLLHDDARATLDEWQPDARRPRVRGRHFGYTRLEGAVTVRRSLALDFEQHSFALLDELLGRGSHRVTTPFHIASSVDSRLEDGRCTLSRGTRQFAVAWSPEWSGTIREGWESPSYGVRVSRPVLELRLDGPLVPLAVAITPVEALPDDVASFVEQMLS